MSIQHEIKNRRTVVPAQFNGKSVSDDEIKELLEMAKWAPTHAKTQPWNFAVVQGDALQAMGTWLEEQYHAKAAKPSEIKGKKFRENLQKSEAVILLFMSRDPKERIPEWEEVAATSMAVQNMWLALDSMDLAGYWSSPKSFGDVPAYLTELGHGEFVEGMHKFLGFFCLGRHDKPEEQMPAERIPVSEKTIWID